jgi:hypothetical protein
LSVPCTAEVVWANASAEVSIYGGVAGEQYDPCYHAACDTFAGVLTPSAPVNVPPAGIPTLTNAS